MQTQARHFIVFLLVSVSSFEVEGSDNPVPDADDSRNLVSDLFEKRARTQARLRSCKRGNVNSSREFIPEEHCSYNSLLWDEKISCEYIATVDKPGRIGTDKNPIVRAEEFAVGDLDEVLHGLK
jgi:hypothetical protein